MKICADCRYYGSTITCKHPNNGISIVTGEPNVKWASQVRDRLGGCKEEGLWFEPGKQLLDEPPIKTATKKPWYKFWSFNA